LLKGGIIVYPTETAYGLGCDAFNHRAINRIFKIKNRPKNLPLSVLVSSIDMIETIAEVNISAIKLIEKYHPGPLVIALPKKITIPDSVNQNNIAFRISSNNFANSIVKLLNRPLISTSANKSGEPTPYSVSEILDSFGETEIDAIFDVGKIPHRKPSTIVDFTLNPAPQITREGGISAKDILSYLNIPKASWKLHLPK